MQDATTQDASPSLDTVLASRKLGPRLFEAHFPTTWMQGRGAFGGLVLGTMVRALLEADDSDGRTLRSLTSEIIGPVQPGPARIEIELLRRGSAVTTLRAELLQGDGCQAHVVAVFGNPRPDAMTYQHTAWPSPPPWQEVPPLELDSPFIPEFVRHFVIRNIGARDQVGSHDARTAGWVAPRVPCQRRDAAFVVAMVDVWWPACLAMMTMPRPVATLTYSLDLVCDYARLAAQGEAPLYFSGRSQVARDGYTSEERLLFDASGQLLAVNHQLIAIIK